MPAPAAESPRHELLTGWGRTAATRAEVLEPGSAEELAERLAEPAPRGVIARGLGRSYGDAAQNAGGRVLRCTRLVEPWALDPASQTVTAAAGLSLGELVARTLPHGLLPHVLPGTADATVGGAIAADVHGKNHPSAGSFAAHVEALTLATPDRGLVEVTPGSGGELLRATAGGMGLTGVITQATLRLARVESAWMRLNEEPHGDLDSLLAALGGDGHAVAWIDGLARGGNLGRGVVGRARHAALGELGPREAARPLEPAQGRPKGGPAWLRLPVTRGAIAALNAAQLQLAARRRGERLVALSDVLTPLDRVSDWNRLFARGFLQYQFAVPAAGGTAVLAQALERFARSPAPPVLVSLRRLGPGRGLLSFPIAGWALAVDVPAGTPGLAELLDSLDERVAEAGGRVYLAKDARLRPDMLAAMYPELTAWQEQRAAVDERGSLRSDMARRLGLVGA